METDEKGNIVRGVVARRRTLDVRCSNCGQVWTDGHVCAPDLGAEFVVEENDRPTYDELVSIIELVSAYTHPPHLTAIVKDILERLK